MSDRVYAVCDVRAELARNEARWGEQNHPDGTGNWKQVQEAERLRAATEAAAVGGTLTWRHILAEEVAEAFAESDPVRLRQELVQVAAVSLDWIASLDRRQAGAR